MNKTIESRTIIGHASKSKAIVKFRLTGLGKLRKELLGSVAMGIGLISWAGSAPANEVAVGGVDMSASYVDAGSGRVLVTNDTNSIDVTVGTAIGSTSAPHVGDAVSVWSDEQVTVTSSADLIATGQAIWVDSGASIADPKDVLITSKGLAFSRDGSGIGAIDVYGQLSIDGGGTGAIDGNITGIYVAGGSPNLDIRDFTSIIGNGRSIYIDSNDGDVSIQGIGQIGDANSADDGIYADAIIGGNINIGGIGSVTGGDDGIEAYTSGAGTTTISVGDVTGSDMGIYARGQTGDMAITVTGAAKGTNTSAIDAYTTTGNITIDGSGAATATGDDRAIRAEADGGDVTVSDFATVTATGIAIEAFSAGGEISITGMGTTGGITSTAEDGIHANGEASGGNVLISGNGAITAGDDGIEAYAAGNGTMTIGVDNDVTANEFGIYARSVDGDFNLAVASYVTVSAAATTGIDALATGTGTTNIDIASGATVEGAGWGVVTGNNATLTNAGTIRTIGDTGAAANTGLGDAIWNWTGSTTFNNDGMLLGQVHTGGTGIAFNNNASGTWIAGTSDSGFGGTADAILNSGTILIRSGSTGFVGLENFSNLSGGVIDLSYGDAATDNLTVQNFTSASGSRLRFNFDSTGANSSGTGFDNSEDGLGTADTIVVTGTASPSAGTLVDVAATGGKPNALTGSVSLIYTGADLAAPTAGATIVDSAYYSFGVTTLEDAAVAYHLVDDAAGGLYLQWVPNITTTTLGGYAGGDLSGTGGTAGGSTVLAEASMVAAGPLGVMDQGVGRAIADTAAFGALSQAYDCTGGGTTHNIWPRIEGTRFSGTGISGDSTGLSVGLEQDLSEMFGTECGRIAGGAFIGVGQSASAWATGSSASDDTYAGAYLRYTAPDGLYLTALGTIGQSDADLTNNIFASTAVQHSRGWSASLSFGKVLAAGSKGHIDLRAFAGVAATSGDGFTDSSGLTIDSTQNRMTSAGINLGYLHDFNANTHGFARIGAKWTQVDRDVTTYGATTSGSVSAPLFTVSTGLNTNLNDNTRFDAGIAGTFGDGVNSINANMRLVFEF